MKTFLLTTILLLSVCTLSAEEVYLNIDYNVDGEKFVTNQVYTNSKGINYKVSKIYYYMFGFRLNETYIYKYVLANSNVNRHKLGDFDLNSIDSLTISFGVSSFENMGVDPNSFPPDHPLAPQNQTMHWGWAAGYRFWMIDGFSDPDGDGVFDKSFQYHALGNEALRTIVFKTNSVSKNGVIDLNFEMDVQKLLSPIDMSQYGIYHEFYNNSPQIRAFIDNIIPSKVITAKVMTSVETNTNSISLSPNPADEYLNFGSEYLNKDYDIISINGNVLKNGRLNENQIQISDLTKGTYFLRIYDEKGIINTAKFVKK